MYAEPPGFDRAQLAATLRRNWGIAVGELDYVPVGFGTHHFRTGHWWINVDERPAERLDKALRAVAALRAAGREFVHAPQPDCGGGCVAAIPGGWVVSVFRYLDGESFDYGDYPDETLRLEVIEALRRLHAATPGVLPEPDSLGVPHRRTLFDALDTTWDKGPYGERVRQLIAAHTGHLTALLARYDELTPKALAGKDSWVVTHGEPHPGNVIRLPGGGIRLIDWDTIRLAPPERDLWMIDPQAGDPGTVELYRRWWELAEICSFTAMFRGTHHEDANSREAWRELSGYLSNSSSQPDTGSSHSA